MIYMLTILLALLLQSAPPPPLTAQWQRPHVARLSWTQPAGVRNTCIFRGVVETQSILIGCWADLPAGATGLSLGGKGPMDGNLKPQPRDIFILDQDGAVSTAQLRGVVYLPVFRWNQKAPGSS